MSSFKVLVLGASGMAGHVISLYLRGEGFTIDTISAKNMLDEHTFLLDVVDAKKFEEFLDSNQYDAVINCIGVLVKQSEEREDLAAYLNAYLPHFLEQYYKTRETKVIHLSSDCVFGNGKPPYKENSFFGPYGANSFYDRSKGLGEIINDKDLTFRMSIIGPDMSKDGLGLFNWFWQQKGEISGYDKVIWNGVTTITLAKAIKAALEQNLSGVYHLVPKASISKFGLLQLLKKVFERSDMNIKPNSDVVLDRTLLNTRSDFKFDVPNYPEMIEEMKNWIKKYPKTYGHYAR